MKCQKCGADIPEGKIYCEQCGSAIQMVPDYNPVEDISIGTEEKKRTPKPPEKEEEIREERRPWYDRWKYGIAALCLIVAGFLIFQVSYWSTLAHEEVMEEIPETVLLEKPEFSVAPGTYDYAPQLVISHVQRADGIIYYTTDGTTPTAGSQVYNRPIEIGEGKTTIRAIFIRSDGVQSEEADGIYEVVFQYPEEPVFSVSSGEFSEGFYVTLTAEDDCQIYYTTNGEEPDRYSRLYQGPIYINPGLTVLRAVSIDSENRESGIMEEIYTVQEAPVQEAPVPEEGPVEQMPEANEVIP